MTLDIDDFDLFVRLHVGFMSFVSDTVGLFPNDGGHPNIYQQLSIEERLEIHDAFYANRRSLTDKYLKKNPHSLDTPELAEIRSWGDFAVVGEFAILRQLKRHAIFLPADGDSPEAYGVVGITQPISEVTGGLPAFATTTLLPFRGQIVFDGIMRVGGRMTGKGKSHFNALYKQAKAGSGVLLTFPRAPTAAKKKRLTPALRVAALADTLRDRLAELREHRRALAQFDEDVLGRVETWTAKNLARQRAEADALVTEIDDLEEALDAMRFHWQQGGYPNRAAAADAALAEVRQANAEFEPSVAGSSGDPEAPFNGDDAPPGPLGDIPDMVSEALFADYMAQVRGIDVDDLSAEEFDAGHAQFRETFDHAQNGDFASFEKSMQLVGADSSEKNATAVKSAYRRLARRLHPDKNPDFSEEAKELWGLLGEAKTALDLAAIEDLELHWQVIKEETFVAGDEPRLKAFDTRVGGDLRELRDVVREHESHPLWNHKGKTIPKIFRDEIRKNAEEDLKDMRAEKRRLEASIAQFRNTPATKKRPKKKKRPAAKKKSAPKKKRASPETSQNEFEF